MTLILAHMQNLKTLDLSGADEGYDWDCGAFMRAIEEYPCAATLETMSVTICKVSGSILSAVRSVKGFQSLKSLELHLDLLTSF